MTTRKQYSPKFKARAAVEANRGENTLSQLGSQFAVHPIRIAKWRKSALEQLPELFVDGRTRKGRAGFTVCNPNPPRCGAATRGGGKRPGAGNQDGRQVLYNTVQFQSSQHSGTVAGFFQSQTLPAAGKRPPAALQIEPWHTTLALPHPGTGLSVRRQDANHDHVLVDVHSATAAICCV
jgi:transposase